MENALKARDREIDAGNLYPEFDVPDYGEIDASETYVGLVRPEGLEVEELRVLQRLAQERPAAGRAATCWRPCAATPATSARCASAATTTSARRS